MLQVNDNLTHIRGDHAYKFGIDAQHVADTRTRTRRSRTPSRMWPTIYAARSGANPFGYTSFAQYFGETDLEYSSNLYGFYVQDDWRLSDRVKVLYGVRYDLYDVPGGIPDAPFEASRDFVIDKNNWAPRFGVVWTLGDSRRSVIRANTGVMYDQALLAMYEQALINDGTNRRAAASFQPTTPGAPAFPAVLSAGAGAQPNTLTTVSPRLRGRAQLAEQPAVRASIERSLRGGRRHVVCARLRAAAHQQHQPDQPDLAPGRQPSDLLDGAQRRRAARSALQRDQHGGVDRRLDLQEPDAAAHRPQLQGDAVRSRLHARQERRQCPDYQRAVGSGRRRPLESRRPRLRQGPNVLDQRHTFTGSIVALPRNEGDNALMRGLSTARSSVWRCSLPSGVPINIRATGEINNDGIASDRPAGVPRNSIRLPARYNVDLRLSRQVPIGRTKAEIIAEVKNVFNTVQWSGVTGSRSRSTPRPACRIDPLPASGDQLTPTGGYEQRQFQLGFRFIF